MSREKLQNGSEFSCVLNDKVSVKRIPLKFDEKGSWENHLHGHLHSFSKDDFSNEVALMGDGLYVIEETGQRFDILHGDIDFEHEEGYENLLFNGFYMKKINTTDDCFDIGFGKPDEEICSRCQGGGCPSCDTTGFFTGIKVLPYF